MSIDQSLDAGTLEARLIHGAGEAVIVADRDGNIRFWNPAAAGMFGYSADEAIGQSLDLIVPQKLRRAHWEGYERVMGTGVTKYVGKTLAVPAEHADGSRISISFTVSLLMGDDDRPVGIGAIIRDVSEEWEEKKAQRRRIAQLERALADRAPEQS